MTLAASQTGIARVDVHVERVTYVTALDSGLLGRPGCLPQPQGEELYIASCDARKASLHILLYY